jgi:hypothetical protein
MARKQNYDYFGAFVELADYFLQSGENSGRDIA